MMELVVAYSQAAIITRGMQLNGLRKSLDRVWGLWFTSGQNSPKIRSTNAKYHIKVFS